MRTKIAALLAAAERESGLKTRPMLIMLAAAILLLATDYSVWQILGRP